MTRRGFVGLRTGLALLLVSIATVASFVSARVFRSRPTLEQGLRAYEQGQWSQAVVLADRQLIRGLDNAEAQRLRARGLARFGRGRDALRQYAALRADWLQVEDLVLIGQALSKSSQSVLAMGALEAASKLEPKHRETTAALAELRSRLSARPADLSRVDRLTAVPSGRALAELVAGLLAVVPEEETGDGLSSTLDRLLRRDRAEFLAIDSPFAARKLLARMWLEEGRAAEARAALGNGAGHETDAEANWLLSRTYLVEGAFEPARTAVNRAGEFGKDAPLAREPSRYTGAKRCAECHETIYRSQQSSRHASTIAHGEGLKSVPLPKATVTDPEEPKVTHRMERSGSEIRVATEVDGATLRAVVDYALGSGRHGVTMLAREESGRHVSMRISYYTAGDHWGITSGFNPHPTDRESYLGMPLSEEGFRACVNCHTTRFAPSERVPGPEAADHGIGCERCHGPGDHHIRAVESGFPQLAIARPKLATPAQRTGLCGQCHSADGETPPSDPRFIRFQATTLAYSRCVTESGGRLDCIACHNPHRNVETNPAQYEARCLTCHGEVKPPEEPSVAMRAARCPVNAKTDCLNCHMPKVENVLPFTSFTDHHIRVHRTESKVGSSGLAR